MKRSGPLQRRSPLQAKAQLGRGKPLERGPGPGVGKPVKQLRRPLQPKGNKARRRAESPTGCGMAWADVRMIIFVRAGGTCEACGRPLNIANMEGHHRRTRRLGPDCPGNALCLCADCHHGPLVHGGPEAARESGRIVSRHDDAPCAHPVEVHGRGLVRLNCDGTYGEVV